MKERPIIFSAPMVRAILEGRKTQTRRTNGLEYVNTYPGELEGECGLGRLGYRGLLPSAYFLKPSAKKEFAECAGQFHWFMGAWFNERGGKEVNPIPVRCPYGVPGDRLWVREAWRASSMYDLAAPREIPPGGSCWWEADKSARKWLGERSGKLRPSIHMPRWASRLTLEIVSVRVERLQAISEEDAIAEGISTSVVDPSPRGVAPIYPKNYVHATDVFRDLWESINGPGSWEANPWAWVLEFKRVEEVSR